LQIEAPQLADHIIQRPITYWQGRRFSKQPIEQKLCTEVNQLAYRLETAEVPEESGPHRDIGHEVMVAWSDHASASAPESDASCRDKTGLYNLRICFFPRLKSWRSTETSTAEELPIHELGRWKIIRVWVAYLLSAAQKRDRVSNQHYHYDVIIMKAQIILEEFEWEHNCWTRWESKQKQNQTQTPTTKEKINLQMIIDLDSETIKIIIGLSFDVEFDRNPHRSTMLYQLLPEWVVPISSARLCTQCTLLRAGVHWSARAGWPGD
jgi:hypothetical protein